MSVKLKDVLRRRELDQALNIKEFSVLTGISYTEARAWLRMPGFPTMRGVVFWSDFVRWRISRFGLNGPADAAGGKQAVALSEPQARPQSRQEFLASLPPKARRILEED